MENPAMDTIIMDDVKWTWDDDHRAYTDGTRYRNAKDLEKLIGGF